MRELLKKMIECFRKEKMLEESGKQDFPYTTEKSGIQYKNWLIVGLEIVQKGVLKKAYLKVICTCGSEQLRSYFHVFNTLGHCNECGQEPATFEYLYRYHNPKIGEKFHSLIIVDKQEIPGKKPEYTLKCELCHTEKKFRTIHNPNGCSACGGLLGHKVHELTMTAIVSNPSGKMADQRIMAKCDCGNVGVYRLSNFKNNHVHRCKSCNAKRHQNGFSNANKRNKMRVLELEEKLRILEEKLQLKSFE